MSKRPKKKGGTTPAPAIGEKSALLPGIASRTYSALLLLILAIALLLRLPGLGTPVGGFHSFNEAHYILVAQNVLRGWILSPSVDQSTVFLETPPLFPYVLALTFATAGVSVLVARLLAVTIGMLLVWVVSLLGRRLFGAEAGLASAALMATAPIAVMVGRNVQTDSMLVLLIVAALVLYHRAGDESAAATRARLQSGFLFGLALFTKLFAGVALLAVVAWDLIVHGVSRPLSDRRRWMAAALVILPAGVFYGYHATRDYRYFVDNVFRGAAGATTVPSTTSEWITLGAEAWWGFSPPVAVLMIAGTLLAVARPRVNLLYLLLPMLSYTLFYLVVHKHSYYLLCLLPFGSLLAAAAVSRIPWRPVRIGIWIFACLYACFLTLVDYGSMKLGFHEFAEASGRLRGGAGMRISVDADVADNAYPVARLYLPRAALALGGAGGQWERDGSSRLSYASSGETATQSKMLFFRNRHGLQLFGWLIAEDHGNPHFFRQGSYYFERTGSLLDFGFPLMHRYPALRLTTPAGSGSESSAPEL